MKKETYDNKRSDNARVISWFFILIFSMDILWFPTPTYAGGPTQPEVQAFAPIGMDNMVDPFTGNFSYNIPLMEIEGYPLNLNYNAGITMDQEASWVGLGWNLNVGEVLRNLRGIPDDFDGDEITTERNMKENKTYDFDLGASFEIAAIGLPAHASLALSYNNYNGWASSMGFGLNFSIPLLSRIKSSLNIGLDFSSSSENGASFSPSLSLGAEMADKSKNSYNLGGNVGFPMNSRAGLQQISYGASFSKSSIPIPIEGNTSYPVGTTSYPISIQNPLMTKSIGGNFKLGPDFFMADVTGSISINVTKQSIPEDKRIIKTPAYGYFNLQNGEDKPLASLDFTRDNDGTFTKDVTYLPSTSLTSDIFSVRAQGIGGSFKGFRQDVGYVFDPQNTNSTESASIGFEAGLGDVFKAAIDIRTSSAESKTSKWASYNNALNPSAFSTNERKSTSYALVEANDFSVDNDLFFKNQLRNEDTLSFELTGSKGSIKAELPSSVSPNYGKLERKIEYPRNTILQTFTIRDLQNGFGINPYNSNLIFAGAKPNHIGGFVYLGNDGKRYVFDLPAYNTLQEDVTFAVGSGLNGNGPTALSPQNDYVGILSYPTAAASKNNTYGIDNYYDSRTTPAYAHSYMLTSVLTDDYIDNDGIQGPSPNDFGNYVKFNYAKVGDFGWRNPAEQNKASFNEGMKSIASDDKANFNYGRKDLLYVDSIESKNYVIVFTLKDRNDMESVQNRDGGFTSSKKGKYLEKIEKFSRIDRIQNGQNATPIQTVHFVYTYDLCKGVPSSNTNQGKLTLKEVYFTYQNSNKMKYSPYVFEYNSPNPNYNLKNTDRWGTYAPTPANAPTHQNSVYDPLTNFEFPYTIQDTLSANKNVAAWCLTDILLPSGGKIHVDYEADDYAYVQNKRADRMFMIAGVEDDVIDNSTKIESVSESSNKNKKIYFKLLDGHDNIEEYIGDLEESQLYFRCLTDMKGDGSATDPKNYEFISGYGKIIASGTQTINGIKYGWLKLKGESLVDGEGGDYSPISKAAIQFGRLYLNEYINKIDVTPNSDSESGLLNFASSLLNSLANFSEFFVSPNRRIWGFNRGRKIVTNKSWIRLVDPTGHKLGGGHRVKQIKMYDNWNQMTGEGDFNYGQEYSYVNSDGTSSGVAENEPMLGADESPLRQPQFYSNKYRFAPDYNLYMDTKPFESQFPSPNIGYSKVTIKNLHRDGVVRTATGRIVKEFYTAREFPFETNSTHLEVRPYKKSVIFGTNINAATASQGFVIITNDMHGKEKANYVYQEGGEAPISSVQYFYQVDSLSSSEFKLTNNVKVIDESGDISVAEIGVKKEAVADFRSSYSMSKSSNLNLNVNGIFVGIVIPIPIPIPSFNSSETSFRSATLNKQIQKFGILKKTVAMENGAIIETNNLVYDVNSGKPLITQTINNFNDSIYNVSYPAYWKYEQMGMAYKNLGTYKKGINILNGNLAWNNAKSTFVEGDVLSIVSNDGNKKAWVVKVNDNDVSLMDKDGNWVQAGNATITIIRSGRQNKQQEPMATLTAMENPIYKIKTNQYNKVLNASAIEFSQDWNTACDCLPSNGESGTVNPFLFGLKGHWRPSKSYTYLTDRSQSNYNGNTNIRKDGVFSTFTPYYYLDGGMWKVNPANWTFTSEVTQFSVNGNPIETKDAIGRYSSSTYGFNNTLQTSAAVNASLRQQLDLHFEDDDSGCGQSSTTISPYVKATEAHTGKSAILVTASNPVTINSSDQSCDKEECNLKLSKSGANYLIENAQNPIDFQYEIIYGSPNVTFDSQNKQITLTNASNADYQVTVKLTDGNGCHLQEEMSNTPQN